MRLPNLLIIGVSKAGTTSLFTYLSQHPEVCPGAVKEVRYFNPLRQGEPLEPVDTYAANFVGCEEVRYAVEATPSYFWGGQVMAAGIDEVLGPDVRLVLCLRNPVERCWSWYRFSRSRTRVPKSMTFEEYLDRSEELWLSGAVPSIEKQPYWGLGGGCYDDFLDPWVSRYGDRLQVIFFDDLVADAHGTLRTVCEWLGLDPAPLAQVNYRAENRTENVYRFRWLRQRAMATNRRSERFFRQHWRLKRFLRRTYYAVDRSRRDELMTPEALARMVEFYRPHLQRLDAQLIRLGLQLPEAWRNPSTAPNVPPRVTATRLSRGS